MTDAEKKYSDDIINSVLTSSFGETSSELSVSFKKTVFIRDYETEVLEANTTLKLDEELTNAERMLVTAMLRIQLEYEAYVNLMIKGIVTNTEFENRKIELAKEVMAIKQRGEQVLGKSLDKYLQFKI